MVEHTKATPKLNGVDEIFLPGEIEARCRQERLRGGIPLASTTVDLVRTLGRECGIEW